MFKNTIGVASALALGVHAGPRWRCPTDYEPMDSFDVNRYAGKWYEIVRDKFTPFELFSSCVAAEYTPSRNG